MPELPEVEILVRHLAPLLKGKTIEEVRVRRSRTIRPGSRRAFSRALVGSTFQDLTRRGKYLVFTLTTSRERSPVRMLGHLGMTGRMYLQPAGTEPSKHVGAMLSLGDVLFVFEDVRGFGRLTLDLSPLARLGPEPLEAAFSVGYFRDALRRAASPIKVKLLDQSLVAGVGNIYASEALFRAGISPRRPAGKMSMKQIRQLHSSLRRVLAEAIRFGSTIPLNLSGAGRPDELFYYGHSKGSVESYEEQLRVYDREGRACLRCGGRVRRIVQAARSTFYCPECQRA